MYRVIAALVERLNGWLSNRLGLIELNEPVVVQDGSAWLRIAPNELPRWYATEQEALDI